MGALDFNLLKRIGQIPFKALGSPYVSNLEKILANPDYEKFFGAKRLGEAGSNVAARASVNDFFATYKRPAIITGGPRFKLETRHDLPAGGFISTERGGFYAAASDFNSATKGGQYGPQAVLFAASGLTTGLYTPIDGLTLKGLIIESEVNGDRYLNVTNFSNIRSLIIEDCEIFGFPTGGGINVRSIDVGWIRRNYIHDFKSNKDYSGGASGAQTSLIILDGERMITTEYPRGRGSNDVEIAHNVLDNIEQGAAFVASHGRQSDGISIGGNKTFYPDTMQVAAYPTTRAKVHNNTIRRVAEAIDTFGHYGELHDNLIEDVYDVGFKLPHGASFNKVYQNTVRRCGRWGVFIGGAAISADVTHAGSVGSPAEGNHVYRNTIEDIDPTGVVGLTSGTTCISLEGVAGQSAVRDNLVERNRLDPGANGKYAVVEQTIAPAVNHFRDNEVLRFGSNAASGGNPTGCVTGGRGDMYNLKKTLVKAVMASAQSTATAATRMNFTTEIKDTLGEYSASNATLFSASKQSIEVAAQIALSSPPLNLEFYLYIYKNDSPVSQTLEITSLAGQSKTFAISDIIDVVDGDQVDVRAYASAAGIAFNTDPKFSHLSIKRV